MDYKKSFGEKHPVLIGVIIAVFIIIAGIPGIAMLSETVACKIGAIEMWCLKNDN